MFESFCSREKGKEIFLVVFSLGGYIGLQYQIQAEYGRGNHNEIVRTEVGHSRGQTALQQSKSQVSVNVGVAILVGLRVTTF